MEQVKYTDLLKKAEEVGYYNLSAEERDIIRRHVRRERNRRGKYPTGGRSESIMRNRVLRAKSFGINRDNIY